MSLRFSSLFVGALLLGLAAGVQAQDARTWMFNFDSDAAVLQYATPDSDDAVLVISCEPGKRSMRIAEYIGSDSLVPGRTAHLKLASGTVTLDYAGQTVSNEMDGTVNIEVTIAPDPKLIAMLKTGTALTLDVAGRQASIPLKDAVKPAAEFEKACFVRR